MRRTFKLTQATYILCYDTENLFAAKDEGERARLFLEKFVNIKLSLFVDSSTLISFLRTDWSKDEDKYQSIPSETMLKLASILSELAKALKEDAARYMPLIGDMRKLKRFVNAVLLMQIEKTDLARTDFHPRDLVNLILLHLNYPVIFRRIYLEETEGRSGIFSIKTNADAGTPENIVEIAHRIYGEDTHAGRALIDRLAAEDRGVLGWSDLILFRLQCSADRQGQIYNLHTALIVHDDMNAPTSGLVTGLAISGMRTISQRIFALFKSRYIDTRRNLFDDVDAVPDAKILGDAAQYYFSEAAKNETERKLRDLVEGTRSSTKTFIVYQLANRQAGTGSGVGCGYYDTAGTVDGGEIATLMNHYMFDVCFNPEIKEQNAEYFLDYCLCNLTSGFWSGGDEDGYYPTQQSLVSGLNAGMLADYWAKHEKAIKARNFTASDKRVVTFNYAATYADDLRRVFDVLDQIQSEKETESQGKNEIDEPPEQLMPR